MMEKTPHRSAETNLLVSGVLARMLIAIFGAGRRPIQGFDYVAANPFTCVLPVGAATVYT